MKFDASLEGTHKMTDHVNKSRERIYYCMSELDFSAKDANYNFFDDDK